MEERKSKKEVYVCEEMRKVVDRLVFRFTDSLSLLVPVCSSTYPRYLSSLSSLYLLLLFNLHSDTRASVVLYTSELILESALAFWFHPINMD